jgi:hypothetical protein
VAASDRLALSKPEGLAGKSQKAERHLDRNAPQIADLGDAGRVALEKTFESLSR